MKLTVDDQKILVVSLAEGSLGMGMKWTILEKWPTTIKITVFPSEGGKPVTKPKDMWEHGASQSWQRV